MAIVERITHQRASKTKEVLPRGAREEVLLDSNGNQYSIPVLSFRDPRHLNYLVKILMGDENIAFHGWGVTGVGRRVDKDSVRFEDFWKLKNNRPPGSKIPLMEPPEYVVKHIDWSVIHPDFRYLQNPNAIKNLWKGRLPFHIIFPYNEKSGSLNQAVITAANDPEVAPDMPVPTFCLFWVNDPAMNWLIKKIKKQNPGYQVGVSSLNQRGAVPPFNTKESLSEHDQIGLRNFAALVTDPLLEPLDIASSHSQFRIPRVDEDPVWTMRRKGSISAEAFRLSTGFPVKVIENIKTAARRAPVSEDLDSKLFQAARKIENWDRLKYLRDLHNLFRIA